MIETEILQKIQAASLEERIAIIELLLQSLKAELSQIKVNQVGTDWRDLFTHLKYLHPLEKGNELDQETIIDFPFLESGIEQPTHSSLSTEKLQRPAFGFMKDTGTVLGDIVSPIIPESDWEVLR